MMDPEKEFVEKELSKAEVDYLQKNVKSSGHYIKYLQEKHHSKKLDKVEPPEWNYYHYLQRKERTKRLKKGVPTLPDIRSLSRLQQEEMAALKRVTKLRKRKLKRIAPRITEPLKKEQLTDKYFREKHTGIISVMSPYEWGELLKKMRRQRAGWKRPEKKKELIKNLTARDYLNYLKGRRKQYYQPGK